MTFLSRLPLFFLAILLLLFATWLLLGRGNLESIYDSLTRWEGFRHAPILQSSATSPYAPAVTSLPDSE